jgi:RNA polymerase sigma factor (sigma-70 family)
MIRSLVEDQRVKALPDRELLRLFCDGCDEAAFHGLLRRHGSMVLDVCRNVLGNEAEAEDAFQATFLVLAQKAGTIRETASVGSWLYGVAYRTALKARAASARRQKHEDRKSSQALPAPADDLTWREARQVVHAELDRFSERYRAPLVLCYLEGKTQDEAALALGVSKATLKKHLERARALLRVRLVRRGLGPAAVLVAGAWPGATASAGLPPALAASTVKAATALAAGHAAAGLVSTKLAALTERVLKAMFLTKLRTATTAALAFAMGSLLLGVALRADPGSASAAVTAGSAAPEPPRAAPPGPDDDPPKADAKKDQNPLQGEWAKTETKQSGRIRIAFDKRPLPIPGSKSLQIRWTPPAEEGTTDGGAGGAGPRGGGAGGGGGIGGGGGGVAGPGGMPPAGAGRGVSGVYELKDKEGKKVLVLKLPNKDDFEVPYKLEGDTLTLDGGVYELGGRGGRPAFLKVELKGEWKRVNTALEDKLRKALPGMDVEGFSIQVESRGQRLVIAANQAKVLEDGRIRLEDCAVARLPAVPEGAKPGRATSIRSEHAIFKLDKPARTVTDLGTGKVLAVEFADGVRMNLQEP